MAPGDASGAIGSDFEPAVEVSLMGMREEAGSSPQPAITTQHANIASWKTLWIIVTLALSVHAQQARERSKNYASGSAASSTTWASRARHTDYGRGRQLVRRNWRVPNCVEIDRAAFSCSAMSAQLIASCSVSTLEKPWFSPRGARATANCPAERNSHFCIAISRHRLFSANEQ